LYLESLAILGIPIFMDYLDYLIVEISEDGNYGEWYQGEEIACNRG